MNFDAFVKSLKTSFDVIPAKAGIQCFQIVLDACLRNWMGLQADYDIDVAQDELEEKINEEEKNGESG